MLIRLNFLLFGTQTIKERGGGEMTLPAELEAKQYYITQDGWKELQTMQKTLQLQREDVTNELKEIQAQSNLLTALEDSVFSVDQNKIIEIDARLKLLNRLLQKVRLIQKPEGADVVQLGSTISLKIDGATKRYTLVGSLEADPSNGKISDESPLGKSLLGKRLHEQFTVPCPLNKARAATVCAIG
jgi:transcription elongation factor GreA